MAIEIIWSPEAIIDRFQILDYWQKRFGHNNYSVKPDNKFQEVIRLISHFPDVGRKVEGRDIRFLIEEHYQIFYLSQASNIQILRMGDSRRNPEDLNL